MSRTPLTLAARHGDFTRQVILDAAIAILEVESVERLTVRAVAARAHLSERTVFRYFPTRERLLDAVASEASRVLSLPPHPASADELVAAPAALYACFEARAKLTRALLHSELFDRIRTSEAHRRALAIRAVIDRHAPRTPARRRKLAAANVRFFLSATTWHYYRFYFGLTLAETVECARMAIRQTLESLRPGS